MSAPLLHAWSSPSFATTTAFHAPKPPQMPAASTHAAMTIHLGGWSVDPFSPLEAATPRAALTY